MGLEGGGTEEEKEEKIPLYESIGHRPFGAAALLPPQFQAQPTQAGHGYR